MCPEPDTPTAPPKTKLDLENGYTYGLHPGLIRQHFLKGIRENYRPIFICNCARNMIHSTCLDANPCPAHRLAQRGVVLAHIYG